MMLYPIPQQLSRGEKSWNYAMRRWVILPADASFRLKEAAQTLTRRMSHGFARPLALTAGEPGAGDALVRMCRDDAQPEQGYRLTATGDGFALYASGDIGWYYGLLSVEQILAEEITRVPELTIVDAPDFRYRGYMLDVSRCKVPTMATLKQIIDDLSRLRYNELQLYMEHTFAFAGDERVWFDNSPLTAAEIMELDAYCASRFIELVPNLNSFGHLERWLRFPEYRYLAESPTPWHFKEWDVYCQGVLAPGQEALAFIDRLYREFLPNFTSKRLNIGCDETVELGKGRSEALCAERGTTRVYLDFLQELNKLAGKYGRQVMFWGDIIMHNPELISELPKGITALEWGYEDVHPFEADTAKFQAAGVPFYVCPGTSSWNTFTGRTANMFGNIASAARHGKNAGAAGLLMTDWGDGGHHQYWPLSWPGLTMAAGCAWNAGQPVSEELLAAAIDRGFGASVAGDSGLGRQLLELGRICEEFAHRPHNCTLFYSQLFNPKWSVTGKANENVTLAEAKNARKRLERWRKNFVNRPPRAEALVLRELDNLANFAELGLDRMVKAKGGRVDMAAWKDRMRHAIGEHSDLWLARNRAGGLHESSDRLRQALEMG